MFVCTELIKESRRPPGLIIGMWGYFWPGSHKARNGSHIRRSYDLIVTF